MAAREGGRKKGKNGQPMPEKARNPEENLKRHLAREFEIQVLEEWRAVQAAYRQRADFENSFSGMDERRQQSAAASARVAELSEANEQLKHVRRQRLKEFHRQQELAEEEALSKMGLAYIKERL